MNYQQIIRNGKTFSFFPDITVSDQTKGFFIDTDDPILPLIKQQWGLFELLKDTEAFVSFSIYLSEKVDDNKLRDLVFQKYIALPTANLTVSGKTIPKQSTIVKKKRVSSI